MSGPPLAPDDRITDVDDFDLRRLVAALRRGWLIILGCAVAAVLIQTWRLQGALPIYRVELEVAALQAPPAVGDAVPAIPDRPHDHGSRQPSVTPLDFTLYLESLHSREVADELARDPVIAEGLPAADGAQVQQYLLSQLSVNQDQRKHTFAILRLQSTRPVLAAHLLEALNERADDHMRGLALARARRMIADLSTLPGADTAVSQVLTEQQRIEASAQSTAPFAAQRISGPTIQPRPLNRPVKSLVAALVVGAGGGAVIALLLDQLAAARSRRQGAAPQ